MPSESRQQFHSAQLVALSSHATTTSITVWSYSISENRFSAACHCTPHKHGGPRHLGVCKLTLWSRKGG